jgi:1,4-alpha-glucan branching enzyme
MVVLLMIVDQSVFAFIRRSDVETLVVILNMTPNVHEFYEIGVPLSGTYEEILNSDKDIYFGSNLFNGKPLKTIKADKNQFKYLIKPTLGPLSGIILRHKK